MLETDLVAMMLLIFLPVALGLALLLMPERAGGLGRVVALFGSALVVTVTLCAVISYYALLDSRLDRTGRPLHAPENQLAARMDALASADAASPPRPRHHEDWVARKAWLERFDIWFALGLDGISLSLILMTSIVVFVAVVVGWKECSGGTLGLLLVLEGGIHGCLLAADLMLLYLFLQAVLVPVWLLTRPRPGGSSTAPLPTGPASVLLVTNGLIFLAVVGLYSLDVRDFVDRQIVEAKVEDAIKRQPGLTREEAVARAEVHTFDLVTLQRAGQAAFLIRTGQTERIAAMPTAEELRKRDRAKTPDPSKVELLGAGASPEGAKARYGQAFFTPTGQYLLFASLMVGFGTLMGIVPLRSWLVEALANAPTPVAMVLGGALVKVGAYGLIRLVWPICPWPVDRFSECLCYLALAMLIHGLYLASRAADATRMVAYLSVGTMNVVLLGMSVCTPAADAGYWSWGFNGASFHLLAHGITASAVLLVVGRRMGASGPGILAFLGLMGMPGLCGFVGYAFVVMGSWHYSPVVAVVAAGSLVAAGRLVLRKLGAWRDAGAMDLREYAALSVLLILSLVLGILPQMAILSWVEPSVSGLVENLSRLRP